MILPLGIFDSGIGGFTVLKKLVERHGDIPLVYLADTERVPYGSKSRIEIREIASEIVLWFSSQKVKGLLIACNTTNSLALDIVEGFPGGNVFGLIQASVEMIDKHGRVGVLATAATTASNAYRNEIQLHFPNTFVIEQPCPALVPLIEKGDLHSVDLELRLKEYLRPLIKADVNQIILGCSHYPLVQKTIQRLLPDHVRIIDPAIGLSRKLDSLLGEYKKQSAQSISFFNTRFCSTSNPLGFSNRATAWLGKCHEAELVSLRSKAYLF